MAPQVLIEQLPPGGRIKLHTFVGDRFIARAAVDESRVLLAVTIGVPSVELPNDLDCRGTARIGSPRAPLPPGPLHEFATLRGWTNDSPCDVIAAYVWPNGTERWMADLVSGGSVAHFEVTYLEHLFSFRLTDGRLVYSFAVAPASIPRCPGPMPAPAYWTRADPTADARAAGARAAGSAKAGAKGAAKEPPAGAQAAEPEDTALSRARAEHAAGLWAKAERANSTNATTAAGVGGAGEFCPVAVGPRLFALEASVAGLAA